MNKATLPVFFLVLLLAACERSANDAPPAQVFSAEAVRIAQSSIIVDTHIDVPYRLTENPDDVSVATDSGDFDYPRAVKGGLNAPFMSIYTAAELEAEGGSRDAAEALIDGVEAIVAGAPDKFAIARSTQDVRTHFETGLMSLALGMENGSPIEGDLENLRHFYDRGIRYITLTHSLPNHISDSSYDDNKQWQGLSDFGVEVVREMNRLGIMVDISHVSDEAFWRVMQISEVPAVATHSSARHFTPDFERNMSDEMIERLAEGGGVIQINFGSSFITLEARLYSSARSDEEKLIKELLPELSDKEIEDRVHPLFEQAHGPYPYATIEDVLDHFDHIVELVGVDHVGIGSDYDGVGDSLPIGLKDVAAYPNLIDGLLRRGYSESDIRKILGENLLRVWAAAEAYARQAHEPLDASVTPDSQERVVSEQAPGSEEPVVSPVSDQGDQLSPLARRASEQMAALDEAPEKQLNRGEFLQSVIEIYQAEWPIVRSPTNTVYNNALIRADRYAQSGDGAFLEALMIASFGPYAGSAEGSEGFRHMLWVNLETNPTLTQTILHKIGAEHRAQVMERWYGYAPHDYDFLKISQELSATEWPAEIESDVQRLIEVCKRHLVAD